MRSSSKAHDSSAHYAWVLLAATLAACSVDDGVAPTTPDQRTLQGHDDGAPQLAASAAAPLSNRFAYVWADQPSAPSYTPNAAYTYNATGGSTQITRQGTGTYQVTFNHPIGWGGAPLGFSLTAYGSSTLGCSLQWISSNVQLVLGVTCYDRVSHLRADSRFTLLVVGNGSLLPRSAFAFGNQPSAPSYTPNPAASYTSGSNPMLITHQPTAGEYNVNMGLGNPAGSTFLVSEQFFFPGYLCTTAAWLGTQVEVHCFDHTAAPKDHAYWALQVDGGRPGRRLGFAWANQPTAASYTPSLNRSFNSSGAGITVTRSGVGRYAVDFTGLQKLAGHTENVQVTPFGTGYTACKVVSWGNVTTGLRVNVECRKVNGTFKDARFNVLVIE